MDAHGVLPLAGGLPPGRKLHVRNHRIVVVPHPTCARNHERRVGGSFVYKSVVAHMELAKKEAANDKEDVCCITNKG